MNKMINKTHLDSIFKGYNVTVNIGVKNKHRSIILMTVSTLNRIT